MDKKILKELGKFIGQLPEDEGKNTFYGICYAVKTHPLMEELPWEDKYDYMERLMDVMAKWPEFSGDREYPVPHKDSCPMTAFNLDDLWVDEYGEARIRLCKFLADNL